jgi:ubiquinone/menaquinone biosynthesis C-methylase UbiE
VTQTTYDRISRWYSLLASSEQRYIQLAIQQLHIQAGEKVLEIGFGPGNSLVAFAGQAGLAGFVAGIDYSNGMAQVAARRVRGAGLQPKIGLVLGDAIRLPFCSASFMAVFMSFTLELFPVCAIPLVLQECRRILNPDGRIEVLSLSQKGQDNLARKLYKWGHRKFPELIDCRPIYTSQSLAQVGFEIIEVRDMSMWALPLEAVLAKPGATL